MSQNASPRPRARGRWPLVAAAWPLVLALLAGAGFGGPLPDGWQARSFGPIGFALPPDWTQVEASGATAGYFGGDIVARQGFAFGLLLKPDPADVLRGLATTAAGQAVLAGRAFDHYIFTAADGDISGAGEIFVSSRPEPDGDHLALVLSAVNQPYAAGRPVFAAILASLSTGQAAAPLGAATDGAALGGLLRHDLPPGWLTTDAARDNEITFGMISAMGQVVVARGAAVTGAGGVLSRVGLHDRVHRGILLGQPVWQTGWDGTEPAFFDGTTFRTGRTRLHLLQACLPDASPVAVLIGGTEDFHAGDELAALLDGLRLVLPEGAAACPDAVLAALSGGSAALVPDAVSLPPTPHLAALPQPAGLPDAAALALDPDRFTPASPGYARYLNGRFGTFILYPSDYFVAEPAPANGDGRSFIGGDGQARFLVFAQANALELDLAGLIAQDKADLGAATIRHEQVGPGWYVLSGTRGRDIFYRRVILAEGNGLIRGFEISYPESRKSEFDPVVAYMSGSFGPL
ncbi:MAG: hypothetical protein Q8Q26_11240 [Pseudorhodobacter sp.]|nr:hypothetical protein [Pseudorhodobacter sp.]